MLTDHLSREFNNSLSRKAQGVGTSLLANVGATWPCEHQAAAGGKRQVRWQHNHEGIATELRHSASRPTPGTTKNPSNTHTPDTGVLTGNYFRKSPSLDHSGKKKDAVCPAPAPDGITYRTLVQSTVTPAHRTQTQGPSLASCSVELIGSSQTSLIPLSTSHRLCLQSTCFSFYSYS